MMIAGGIVIIIAQVQMGASWRIGLDQERTALATAGLFAWSRNPTFLGMVTLVLGAFVVAPTAVTGAVFVVTWIGFSVLNPDGGGTLGGNARCSLRGVPCIRAALDRLAPSAARGGGR